VNRFYPGIHFFDSGLDVTGGVMQTVGDAGVPNADGEGSMFFNTTSGTTPNRKLDWAGLTITGNVVTNLKPMTSGTHKGILFFEGRDAPKQPPGNRLVGTSNSTFDGFLYFSATDLTFGGNTSANGWTGIIADRITFEGNVSITGPPFDDISDETELRTVMLLE
jgi:hypothetical protein